MKKKKKISVVSVVLIIIGLLLIGFSAYKYLSVQQDYKKSINLYTETQRKFTVNLNDDGAKLPETATEKPREMPEWAKLCQVDFAGLKAVNPDVVAWIYFENEDLSYPILQGTTLEQYLHTTLEGKSAIAGSIFMEPNNSSDMTDSHTIVYGHNMRNLSMFGKLKFYRRDENYYSDHMYFQIITENAAYRYQIFGYEEVEDDSDIYTVPFGPNEEFEQFISKLKSKSYRDTGVEVGKEDKVVTLSTCTTTDDHRFVVHGVVVDSY